MVARNGVGVFLCQGGGEEGDSPEFRRLRWTAQAVLPQADIFEVRGACRPEGAETIAKLVAEHGLGQVLLAACPAAGSGLPLVTRLGGDEAMPAAVQTVDICASPEGARGLCQVTEGAHRALRQAGAALADWTPAESAELEPERRVLVLGVGISAMAAARGLAASGHPVLLVSPRRRLDAPEPLLGPKARELSASLAAWLDESPEVEVISAGRLLGLSGAAGDFTAVVQDTSGERRRVRVGAAVVTQGPSLTLNLAQPELAGSDRVMSLAALLDLAATPEYLAGKIAGEAPRVALAVGLYGQPTPADLEAALLAAETLLAQEGAEVTLFTTNAKVAAFDLERRSQEARAQGMRMIKFSAGRPVFAAGPDGIDAEFIEEVLGRPMSQEFDLLAVEQRPAPSEGYELLARRLGLAVAADGRLQPSRVATLPSGSKRAGVLVIGDARGPADLSSRLLEAQQAVSRVGDILSMGGDGLPASPVRVDRKRCALCLTCVRVCPRGAMTVTGRRPGSNPLACTGCGTCAAECPMDAIQILNQEDERLRRVVDSGLDQASMVQEADTKPALLVLACANSASQALAAAAGAGRHHPATARLVQVPCAGRIDPELLLHALGSGFDAVLVLSCHPGACYSLEGNTWSSLRLDYLRGELKMLGVGPQRLMQGAAAANEPGLAAELVERAVEQLAGMGPNPLKSTARVRELLRHFTLSVDRSYTIMT